MVKLVLFNKPFGVLTQFTDPQNRPTLAQYIPIKDVYPAGRLDKDSEGLVILTNDGKLQHQIANPEFKLEKTYLVQVEGKPTEAAMNRLQLGVELKDGITKSAQARIIPPPDVWERDPPIRQRESIPTTWVEIKVIEGRNRMVRRMTAAVGFPTLRLIRTAIGEWQLDGLAPGEYKVLQ